MTSCVFAPAVAAPTWLLSGDRRAAAIALDVHFENDGVVDEMVDGCAGHGGEHPGNKRRG
jgi:hypothetical protein